MCSRRLLTSTNHVATEHPKFVEESYPYLKHPKKPNQIFPGTQKYYWKCKGVHRVLAGGADPSVIVTLDNAAHSNIPDTGSTMAPLSWIAGCRHY